MGKNRGYRFLRLFVVASIVPSAAVSMSFANVKTASASGETTVTIFGSKVVVQDDTDDPTPHNIVVDLVAGDVRIRDVGAGSGAHFAVQDIPGYSTPGCAVSDAGRTATCPKPTDFTLQITMTGASGPQSVTIEGNMTVDFYGSDISVDIYHGGPGIDRVWGKGFNDELYGGPGDDELYGGYGDDVLDGEAGNDILVGNQGEDRMRGGSGTGDGVRYFTLITGWNYETLPDRSLRRTTPRDGLDDWDWRSVGVTANLNGLADDGSSQDSDGDATDGMDGDWIESGVEQLYGSEFDDTLAGDAGANSLNGYGGDDTLVGNAGDDSFRGHAGNDTIRADDGEKDSDISCNNSDSSAGTNPNTIYYDEGLDSVVAPSYADCSIHIASGGSPSGGSASGGSTESSTTTTTISPAPTSTSTSVAAAVVAPVGEVEAPKTAAETRSDRGVVKFEEGAPTMVTAPFLVPTSPDEGDTISVFPGRWTGKGIKYSYEWKSCSTTDVEKLKCTTLKKGPTAETYRVATSDLNRIVVVNVTAAVGSKDATAVTMPTAPVDPKRYVNIPASFEPKFVGDRLAQINVLGAQAALYQSVQAGVAQVSYIAAPLKKVPKELRKKIVDNSVFSVMPQAGTTVVGRGSKPAVIVVRYYDKALDFAGCPNKDIDSWSRAVAGMALPDAIGLMKKGGCDWRLKWVAQDAKLPYMQVLKAELEDDPEDDVETASIVLSVSEPRLDEYAIAVGVPAEDRMPKDGAAITLDSSMRAHALTKPTPTRIWASLQWLNAGIGRTNATFQLFDINGRLVDERQTTESADTVMQYAFRRGGVARMVATVDENQGMKGVKVGATEYRQVFIDFSVVEGGDEVLLDGRCISEKQVVLVDCYEVADTVNADKIKQKIERRKIVPYGKYTYSAPAIRDAYLKGIRFSVQAANRKLKEDLVSVRATNASNTDRVPDGVRMVKKFEDCGFFWDLICQVGKLFQAFVGQSAVADGSKSKKSAVADEITKRATAARFTEESQWGGFAAGNCIEFGPTTSECFLVARSNGSREQTMRDLVLKNATFRLGINELIRLAAMRDPQMDEGEVLALIAAGGQNLIAAGGQNVVPVAGKSLGELARLISNEGYRMKDFPGAQLKDLAVKLGMNPDTCKLIAAGGQNLIAAGGQNLIAAGGQNLIAAGGQNLIAAGGQNFSDSILAVTNLIGLDASGILNDDANSLIGLDASGLIGLDASGLTSTGVPGVRLDAGEFASVANGGLSAMSQAGVSPSSLAKSTPRAAYQEALMLAPG